MLLFSPSAPPAYKAATGFVFLPTSEVHDIYCTSQVTCFFVYLCLSFKERGSGKEEKEKYPIEINTCSFGMSRV